MLSFPTVEPGRLAKLTSLANLEKGGASWQDEPRVPAGQPGGGQWTTGGEGDEAAWPSQPRREDVEGLAGDEVVVASLCASPARRTPAASIRTALGGGVLYIPSVSDGQAVRSTEVHVIDASAFRVGWNNDTITLKDSAGHLYAVSADDLAHFNATTGRMLGVGIYTHPDEPLGSPDSPPTAAEQRELAQERADLEAGERVLEQSWSGRLVTGAGMVVTALPLIALLPEGASTVPTLALNTAEENAAPIGIKLALRLGAEGERAVGITGPKVGIRMASGQWRFPDLLDTGGKTLTEVKNVVRLRLTPQLQDFLTYCQANGYRFVLYMRRGTEVSPELEDMIERDAIERRTIPRSR